MTTIKRYTNMRQSASSGGASPKGSKNNPYTEEEFNNIPAEDWKGGYVEGIGYVGPGVVVTPSSEDPSDPFSDLFSDLFSNGDSDHGSAGGQTGEGGGFVGGGHNSGNGGNTGDGGNAGNSSNGGGNGISIGYTYSFDNNGVCTVTQNNLNINKVDAGGLTHILSGPIHGISVQSGLLKVQFSSSFDTFAFFANHTNVEWGISYNADGQAFIHTSNDQSHVETIAQTGFSYYAHSHPAGTSELSDMDKEGYLALLRATYRNGTHHYTHWGLFVNGAIIDKTEEVWEYAKDNDPFYNEYKHLRP